MSLQAEKKLAVASRSFKEATFFQVPFRNMTRDLQVESH